MIDPKDSRKFLKANWKEWNETGEQSDQQKGLPGPAPQKPFRSDAKLVDLVAPEEFTVGDMPLRQVIAQRASRRKYTDESLTLEELSFLCGRRRACGSVEAGCGWRGDPQDGPLGRRSASVRDLSVRQPRRWPRARPLSVPADGAQAAADSPRDYGGQVGEACCGQRFVGAGAVVFIWTAIPYRME